jgi:hypothetical protein
MNSTKRILLTAAAVLAIASPAASARPAAEQPAGSSGGKATAVQPKDHSTIATHRDQITQAQWDAVATEPELALADGTTDDGGRFPIGLVLLIAIGGTLGVVLVQVVGKSVIRHRRDHRLA